MILNRDDSINSKQHRIINSFIILW